MQAHDKVIRSLISTSRLLYRDNFGGDMQIMPHHRKIARALHRVAVNKTIRLIINMPPRSGKTMLVSQMFPAWVMGLNPTAQFILTSYSATLASNNTYAVREMMRSGMYQYLFGANGAKVAGDRSARDLFRTARGGQMYAVGAGGTITGFGAGKMSGEPFQGCIIVDDSTKPEDANSSAMLEKMTDWYKDTLQNRVNSTNTPIVLVAQRLNIGDLPGWLLDGGSGEEWELLKIPALDENDKSFWEQQFPAERLIRMRQAMPYTFAGQYQQDPVPKKGVFFDWAKLEIVEGCPRAKKSVWYWDKAGSADDGAYTAGVKMIATHDGEYIITNVVRGQWSALTREKIIRQTLIADQKTTRKRAQIWIEQEPGSGGKESAEATIRNLAGFVIRADRPGKDKESRAEPLQVQIEAGNVKLLTGDWNEDFISEIKTWPNGKYKDQGDAAAGAFNKLTAGGSSFL